MDNISDKAIRKKLIVEFYIDEPKYFEEEFEKDKEELEDRLAALNLSCNIEVGDFNKALKSVTISIKVKE